MGRASEITLEIVIEALATLRRDGVNPTVSAIRDLLGGKGSFSTLTPLVNKALEMEKRVAVEISELPEEIVKAAEKAAATIYAVARHQAISKIEIAETSAKKAVEQAEARMSDALQEILRLERALEVSEEERGAAIKSREDASFLLQKESVRAERAEALLESIEKRLIDVQADADKRIESASLHAGKAAEEAAELRGQISAMQSAKMPHQKKVDDA